MAAIALNPWQSHPNGQDRFNDNLGVASAGADYLLQAEPFIGPPPGDVIPGPRDQPREMWGLPDAYIGQSLPYVANTIVRLLTNHPNSWMTGRVLPLKENQTTKVAWEVIEFDRGLVEFEPELGVPRLATMRRHSRQGYLSRHGMALEVSHGYASSEKGQMDWIWKLRCIAGMVQETMDQAGIMALVQARDHYKRSLLLRISNYPTLLGAYSESARSFGGMQFRHRNWQEMHTFGQTMMSMENVEPDTWIVPVGVQSWASISDHLEINADKAGASTARHNIENGYKAFETFRGCIVHGARPVCLDQSSEVLEPLARARTIGKYVILPYYRLVQLQSGGPCVPVHGAGRVQMFIPAEDKWVTFEWQDVYDASNVVYHQDVLERILDTPNSRTPFHQIMGRAGMDEEIDVDSDEIVEIHPSYIMTDSADGMIPVSVDTAIHIRNNVVPSFVSAAMTRAMKQYDNLDISDVDPKKKVAMDCALYDHIKRSTGMTGGEIRDLSIGQPSTDQLTEDLYLAYLAGTNDKPSAMYHAVSQAESDVTQGMLEGNKTMMRAYDHIIMRIRDAAITGNFNEEDGLDKQVERIRQVCIDTAKDLHAMAENVGVRALLDNLISGRDPGKTVSEAYEQLPEVDKATLSTYISYADKFHAYETLLEEYTNLRISDAMSADEIKAQMTHYYNSIPKRIQNGEIGQLYYRTADGHVYEYDEHGHMSHDPVTDLTERNLEARRIESIADKANGAWVRFRQRIPDADFNAQGDTKEFLKSLHFTKAIANAVHRHAKGDKRKTPKSNVSNVSNSPSHAYPFDFMLARPTEEYIMGSAILCKAGRGLGHSYYGHQDFMMSDDAQAKKHFGHLTIWTASIVHDETQMFMFHDVFCMRYVNGGGRGILSWDKKDNLTEDLVETMRANVASIIALPVPIGAIDLEDNTLAVENPVDLSGNMDQRFLEYLGDHCNGRVDIGDYCLHSERTYRMLMKRYDTLSDDDKRLHRAPEVPNYRLILGNEPGKHVTKQTATEFGFNSTNAPAAIAAADADFHKSNLVVNTLVHCGGHRFFDDQTHMWREDIVNTGHFGDCNDVPGTLALRNGNYGLAPQLKAQQGAQFQSR